MPPGQYLPMRMLTLLQVIFGAGAVCGIAFYLMCIVSALDYLRSRRGTRGSGQVLPGVSILKPLRGTDPGMYESFRTHCCQDYPDYEIIFGISEADDPAAELVGRLQREFPQCTIRLLVCADILGSNVKVSNLVQMLPHARHHFVLVNDSDIRVAPDYLRRVMSEFADPRVGLVTSLYRGNAASTLGSRLEALGISTEFMSGVLAARTLETGLHFALGSTIALRREALQAIGGFEAVLDYLADDYELGYRIAGAGYDVCLASTVVETLVPAYSFRDFFSHQLRWGRSTRNSRRWGYFGLVLTFGFPWAVLAAIVSRGAGWAWILLVLALLCRLLMALVVGGKVVGDRQVLRDSWLLPLRDMIAVVVWIGSYTGRTVSWRGRRFILKDKKLRPA
jgi:ceramide glucosyltransferase